MSSDELRKLVAESGVNWHRADPANEPDLQALLSHFGDAVPADYLDFLRITNGGEGELPAWPWFFVIWAAETVIERWNEHKMEEFIPRYMAFGSNAGDEMLVFNLESERPDRVYAMPYVGMQPGAEIPVADSFRSFVGKFGKGETSGGSV